MAAANRGYFCARLSETIRNRTMPGSGPMPTENEFTEILIFCQQETLLSIG